MGKAGQIDASALGRGGPTSPRGSKVMPAGGELKRINLDGTDGQASKRQKLDNVSGAESMSSARFSDDQSADGGGSAR